MHSEINPYIPIILFYGTLLTAIIIGLCLLGEKKHINYKEKGVVFTCQVNGFTSTYTVKSNNPKELYEKIKDYGFMRYYLDNCYSPSAKENVKIISVEPYYG